MVFINRKLLFGVNFLRCIRMTLDRKLPGISQNLKKEKRVSKISFILWQKTNAEVVWLFPIRSVSSKEKRSSFRL